ncbi:hypothetical protein DV735_g1232, partial [Chaetothyriales sp. CBS 134920]
MGTTVLESRPIKRRKVGEDSNDQRGLSAIEGYVTLAEAKFEVELRNFAGERPPIQIDPNGEPVAVSVKKHAPTDTDLILSTGSARKGACIAAPSLTLSALERDVLEATTTKLDSILQSRTPGKAPLACYDAVLHAEGPRFVLSISILWEDSINPRPKVSPVFRELLHRYLPDQSATTLTPSLWEPRDFYDNVHVPAKTPEASADINIDKLTTQLYPFQRRTIRWMLSKEGVSVNSDGAVSPLENREESLLPNGFSALCTRSGATFYVNHALGLVSSNLEDIQRKFRSPIGGLLADEMGLGKTLALIGIICLHRRSDLEMETSNARPRKSASTLVITPPTILEQWKQELMEHAPELTVYHYRGMRPTSKGINNMVDELAKHDIVLTTYNVIAKEVHYVNEKPDRTLRNKPRFQPPKSPLTEISWWRVCLDEAQMVESGVSAAATVARIIPREIAWAVTGTPVRKGHHDLWGLMLFLRYEPWCQSKRLWDYLVDYQRPFVRSLIGDVAIRHSKDFVREELRLPPQSRHIITLPFTPVEEQHYKHLFDEMCEDIGLDHTGAPVGEDWDPEDPSTVEKMRRWLTRLRQTCLHPEVGARNRRALGRSAGPLRTVQQVLDVMIENNEGIIRTEQRNLLITRVRQGQLLENAKDIQAALDLWKAAYRDSCQIVDECRELLKQEKMAQKEVQTRREASVDIYRQRLRSALEVKHICIFFMANAYFQLKSDEAKVLPESEEFHALEKQETEAYDTAKVLRGEMLAEVLWKANRLIKKIHKRADEDALAPIPDIKAPEDYTGIESRKYFDRLYDFAELWNTQSAYLRQLRQKMVEFLRQPLVDEDEGVELQGDEYESSTKHQDEMYAYMEALRAHFADRSDAISGQENRLIRQEMNTFNRAAKENQGPAPELMLKLLAERDRVRINPAKDGSLRGIVGEIRALVTSLDAPAASGSARARAELEIAHKLLTEAQVLVSEQSKALKSLEQEVGLFRDTMNMRLAYYRALQKISDTVAPYEEANVGKPLDEAEFKLLQRREKGLSDRLTTLLSKRRYLSHLKTESNSSSRICTICQSEFEVGTLTVCGHQFCKDCIQLWWHENHNCPICKRRLALADFHDITYKPAEMAVQVQQTPSGSASPSSSRDESTPNQGLYSDINAKTLAEIKNIELQGGTSFGSKIDMLVRHILWIRDHDPGSKSIIFSQYREFIEVLGRAFRQFGVTYTAFDDRDGIQKFKKDPSVECFLLHAKAHSAGLNLVCASHVFLCEPLLAAAVELQAIARVHRIGQHRATSIFMYIIGNTVEESIYRMSVARRLAHVNRGVSSKGKATATPGKTSRSTTPPSNDIQEDAIDVANSLELQAADLSKLMTSGKRGGELVAKQDLWQCLFGALKQQEVVMQPESEGAGGQVGRIDHQYVALKVYVHTSRTHRELPLYEDMGPKLAASQKPGRKNVRKLLNSFEIDGPHGRHIALVFQAAQMSLRDMKLVFRGDSGFDEKLVKGATEELLKALDFLHTEAHVIHTDIHPGNLLLGIDDDSLLRPLEDQEFSSPVPRKIVSPDRTIYLSRLLRPKLGPMLLSDFGEARSGPGPHAGDLMPIQYRAPEVIMCMGLAGPNRLFTAKDEDGDMYDAAHLAELIATLGPPPLEFIRRNPVRHAEFWDEKGNWLDMAPIPPNRTLEELLETRRLKDPSRFIAFLRRVLTWDPEQRPTAAELLQDPWFKAVVVNEESQPFLLPSGTSSLGGYGAIASTGSGIDERSPARQQHQNREDRLGVKKNGPEAAAPDTEPVTWLSLPRKGQLAILTLTRLCEPLAERSFGSYMFAQLSWFDPALPPSTITTQGGILTAAFAAAQFVTAVVWGRAADSPRLGRKTVLLVGLSGTAISLVGIGFSRSFTQILCWRLLSGALNGNVGVLRTMVSEIIAEKKFQSRAFLLLPMCFNVGVVVGPLMGGLLADPVRGLPDLFGPGGWFGGQDGVGWMKAFPYALPSMVGAMIVISGVLLVLFGLEETHVALKDRVDYGLRLRSIITGALSRLLYFGSIKGQRNQKPERPYHYTLLPGEATNEDDGERGYLPEEDRHQSSSAAAPPLKKEMLSPPPFRQIFTRNVILTLLNQHALALHISMFNALIFLLLPAPSSPNKDVHLPFLFTGGLGLSPGQLGLATAVIGIVGLPLQVLVYPSVNERLGTLTLFKIFLPFSIIAYSVLPYLTLLPSLISSGSLPGWALWACLSAVLILQVISRTFALPSGIILVNNCSPGPACLGTIHGLGAIELREPLGAIELRVGSVYDRKSSIELDGEKKLCIAPLLGPK